MMLVQIFNCAKYLVTVFYTALNDLARRTLLGNTKLFVTKVPFFSLLAGAVSELVVWLSVESVVPLFSTKSSTVGSDCGVGAGAGIGAGGLVDLVQHFDCHYQCLGCLLHLEEREFQLALGQSFQQ